MGRNEEFEESLRKARRKIYYLINEKTRQFADDVCEKIAIVFVERARARLAEYADPKDSNSIQLLNNLINSITARQLSNGYWSVVIPADEEGLFMFLEFGTGILGESGGHPEAGSTGWEYNVNPEKHTPTGAWVYRYDKKDKIAPADEGSYPYLDKNDIYPLTDEHRKTTTVVTGNVRGYIRKDGTVVKPYVRHRKKTTTTERAVQRHNRVMSWGLFPTRYIYNTKQEILELFQYLSRYKNQELTMQDVYKAIEELRRRPV